MAISRIGVLMNTINAKMIEAYMKTNKISKNKFCKLCKISVSTLKKVLSNDYNFGIVALFKIARVMKISIYQLFDDVK